MNVEVLAVNAISTLIAHCPHLDPEITIKDKTPFTDGHIDLYRSSHRKNANWRGRVIVQVKGRKRPSKRRPLKTFSLKRETLSGYLAERGVLFFLVTIDPASRQSTPYYALLSPFAIKAALDMAPDEKKKIPVELKQLPLQPSEIERIVDVAFRSRDQNHAVIGTTIMERLESFTLHSTSPIDFDQPVTIDPQTGDATLVANTSDGSSVHLDGLLELIPQSYTEQRLEGCIQSGGICFDNATTRRINADTVEIILSDGIKLSVISDLASIRAVVVLTLSQTLADRLKSFEFYLALVETGSIELDGHRASFTMKSKPPTAELRKQVKSLRALTDLCNQLDVDPTLISIDEIDSAQARELEILYRAIVHGEEIKSPRGEAGWVTTKIGQWQLVTLMKTGPESGSWQLLNPFHPEQYQQFLGHDEQGAAIPITPYEVAFAESHDPSLILNLNLRQIVSVYESIVDSPHTFELAGQRVAELIQAGDSCSQRIDEFWEAAARLNDWLVSQQGNNPPLLINQWQIAYRRGNLTVEDRRKIRDMKHQVAITHPDEALQYKLACALLLEETEEIEYLAERLDHEQLRAVQLSPIWKLHSSQ